MQVEALADDSAVARRAAALIAGEARAAVRARGRFMLAVSGGRTPWHMLRELAHEDMPWPHTHLFQVDERVAPAGDAARNLTHIRESLLEHVPLPAENLHAMPVEADDLDAAVLRYAATLKRVAATPAILDLVHLGIGPDGHTASLVPGDAVLHVDDADVALTAPYQGHQRMTLTYPLLNRARMILWLATGSEKQPMVARLRAGDAAIPAGRIEQANAHLLCDRAALGAG